MDTKDLRDIELYLLLHGHDDLDLYSVDDEVLSVMKELVELSVPEISGVEFPYIRKNTMTYNAKKFLSSHLQIHPVGYLSDRKLISLLKDRRIVDEDSLIEIYNKSASFVSPFKIPIEYTDNSVFSGSLETQLLVIVDKDLYAKILPRLEVFFNRICLSKFTTDIGTACYIHEIIHSQLECWKGIIGNYYNSEVLSIFMELFYVYENNPLAYDVIISNRINHLLVSFNNMYLFQTDQIEKENYTIYNYCSDGKYLISIFKAFHLFNLYIHSNNSSKKKILSNIQLVIDGHIMLEDFLDKNHIYYENSLDSVITNQLIKK